MLQNCVSSLRRWYYVVAKVKGYTLLDVDMLALQGGALAE